MSPRCFGKIMVPSCPAPAAVPEEQRWSTLEFHRFQRRAESQRMSPEHRRLTHSLLLSLLIHALLLRLTFGGQGLSLPGFGFPWQDRRIEAPDLRVALVPAPVTATEPAVTPGAEPLQQAQVEQSVARGPALTPSVSRAPTTVRLAPAVVSEANPKAEGDSRSEAKPRTQGKRRPDAKQRTAAATAAAPAKAPLRADRSGDAAPPRISAPDVIALERTDEDTWVVPATPAMPPPVIAAAPSASSTETAAPSPPDAGDAAGARIDQEARERAEGQRQAELESARQDVARDEVARAESARLEAEHQAQAAQVEAARVRAAQVEAARVKAAQIKAAQVEAARVKAAEVEAA